MTGPEARHLGVWFNAEHVGLLREQNGLWTLDYDPAWLRSATGFDLTPMLPRRPEGIVDGASWRPVQWFFDNLLPEAGMRLLLAGDARVSIDDAFGLLAWYGRESAGALTLLPPDEKASGDEGYSPLADTELSQRIRRLPSVALTHDAPKKISLAGAQHKLAVNLIEHDLLEPRGNTPSTHILKPDHQDEGYPHSVINEWFAMTLAGRVGLRVPSVGVRYVPEPVYWVERFDRLVKPGEPTTRRQTLDACQLLGLDRALKYLQATPDALNRLIDTCREKAGTRLALYRWVVFNTLIGNDDSHLKNLSFHVAGDAHGTTYSLAPHYDLLCTAIYPQEHDWHRAELPWIAGPKTPADQLTREHVLAFAKAIDLPRVSANRELDRLLHSVPAEGRKLLDDLPAGVLAGERRLTRLIVHGVVQDMASFLRRRE